MLADGAAGVVRGLQGVPREETPEPNFFSRISKSVQHSPTRAQLVHIAGEKGHRRQARRARPETTQRARDGTPRRPEQGPEQGPVPFHVPFPGSIPRQIATPRPLNFESLIRLETGAPPRQDPN